MAKFHRYLSPFLLLSNIAFSQRCFYPGMGADGDYPCDPDAEESMCCGTGPGAMCLTNRACQRPGHDIIRGSCTDETWGSPECPHFCTLQFQGMGPYLISCANVTGRDTSFCCANTEGCCDRGIERFELLPSDPQPFAVWDEEQTRFVAVTTTTTSTSTTASTTTLISTSATSSATLPSPQTSTLGSSGQNQPSESPQAEPSGLPVAAQAGIGVGISICGILLAVIAYLLRKLYQNRKQANSQINYTHYGEQQHPAAWYPVQPRQEMSVDPAELYTESPYTELSGVPKPTGRPDVATYSR